MPATAPPPLLGAGGADPRLTVGLTIRVIHIPVGRTMPGT